MSAGNPGSELVCLEPSVLDRDTSQSYGHAGAMVPLLTPWMPGPAEANGAPVLVSVTDFHAEKRRELLPVALLGHLLEPVLGKRRFWKHRNRAGIFHSIGQTAAFSNRADGHATAKAIPQHIEL